MRNVIRAVGSGVAILTFVVFSASAARADLIVDGTLTLNDAPTEFFQQTTSSPCVIGGNNCQNPATFLFTDAPSGGGGVTHDYLSPIYTDDQIEAITGGAGFTFGLDYNQSNNAQILYIFEANYYNGTTLISSQIFDTTTSLPTNNNGVGYSDFLLSGFVIPVAATNVQFRARWFNNDGPDRYFIIAPESQPCTENCTVPEPASMALFGVAAAAAAFVRRRRKVIPSPEV